MDVSIGNIGSSGDGPASPLALTFSYCHELTNNPLPQEPTLNIKTKIRGDRPAGAVRRLVVGP